MILKNKIKALIAIILLSIGLSACDNTPDYSGTYTYTKTYNNSDTNTFSYTLEKINDNKYKVTKGSSTYIWVIEDKKFAYTTNGAFKRIIAEFISENELKSNADGEIYKKVK